jgi:hypothetical protein
MFAQNFCKFEANSWHLVTDARDDLFEELTWQVLCVRDWVRVGRMSTAIQKIRAIAIATVVVAILDIGEDMIYCRLYLHVGPRGLFRFIASSVLGLSDAMSLGWRAVLLGVVLHTAVSFGVVLAYFFLSNDLPILRRRPITMGTLYGIAVYCVMHYGIVPLTAVPKIVPPNAGIELANQLFAHIFMVGIPTALILNRFGPHEQADRAEGFGRDLRDLE